MSFDVTVTRLINMLAVLVAGILFSASARADLILTAPPRESVAAGQELYGPLADYLTTVIGQTVRYEHPGDWRAYQRKMQAGEYAIIFDGPHFAAWRLSKQMHYPAIKLAGKLSFVLVTAADATAINTTNDLVGKRVCALPSPNLATLTLYSMYPNPMQQPTMVFIKDGGMPEVAKGFMEKKCHGAILRKGFYAKKMSAEYRKAMRVLNEKGVTTNQGITVTRELGEAMLQKIITSLSSPTGHKAMQPILERFTKKNEFAVARAEDYEGQNLLVDNMIFGWR